MEDQPQEQKPYKLYEDPDLQLFAEHDMHFELLLEGLQKAESIADSHPDDPTFANVTMAAEEGVRAWIARRGYITQEGRPTEDKS